MSDSKRLEKVKHWKGECGEEKIVYENIYKGEEICKGCFLKLQPTSEEHIICDCCDRIVSNYSSHSTANGEVCEDCYNSDFYEDY